MRPSRDEIERGIQKKKARNPSLENRHSNISLSLEAPLDRIRVAFSTDVIVTLFFFTPLAHLYSHIRLCIPNTTINKSKGTYADSLPSGNFT